MKPERPFPWNFAVVLLGLVLATPLAAASPQTYVIVHGATGGGWDWKTVDHLLTADGNTVYRPTLTGLGERVHLANPDVNLTTHVTDIVNVILFEDLHDVVLVGHSYGGMVITGVMDKVPDRIRHVIFLDAAAPDDGQSAKDLWGDEIAGYKVENGMLVFPWVDATKPYPRDVLQPLKTITEPVVYRNPAAKLLPVTYVWFKHPDYQEADRQVEAGKAAVLHAQRAGPSGPWTATTPPSAVIPRSSRPSSRPPSRTRIHRFPGRQRTDQRSGRGLGDVPAIAALL